MRWLVLVILFLSPCTVLAAGQVNINTATASQLESLTGIGSVKAQAIVDYRKTYGFFEKREDIMHVSGVGQATFNAIKSDITVGAVAQNTDIETDKSNEQYHTDDTSSLEDDEYAKVELTLPQETLALSMNAPDIVYVHQPVAFDVEPLGVVKAVYNSLTYSWNFGDFYTNSTKAPIHSFDYAGEYVVTVYASYARHEQVAQKKILVLPVRFSITRNSEGDIQIHNNAKYQIDISGYNLMGVSNVTFPPRTIILSGSTITVPQEEIKVDVYTAIRLLDQKGEIVASTNMGTFSREEDMENAVLSDVSNTVSSPTKVSEFKTDSETKNGQFIFASENKSSGTEALASHEDENIIDDVNTGEATYGEDNTAQGKTSWPILALIAITSVGIMSVYIKKV